MARRNDDPRRFRGRRELGVRGGEYRPDSGRRRGRSGLGWLVIALVALAFVVFVLPPLFGGMLRSMAEDNPDLIRLPFFADAVAEGMDERIDEPAGTDDTPVTFTIVQGTSARQITDELVARGLVTDRLAFSYLLITEGVGSRLRAGSYTLDRTMSPRQVAQALQRQPQQTAAPITVALRDGLRIEQVTAYLYTLDGLGFNPNDFFNLATDPPDDLLADYAMLDTLPDGRSLEGYLGFGVFQIAASTDAEGFLRILLERRHAEIADLAQDHQHPELSFHEVLTLASIVEREAALDREKALIAGVFQNRLDGLEGGRRLLNSDSAIIYAKDTMRLREQATSDWVSYVFWTYDGLDDIANFRPSDDLMGYQTWHSRGLPPGPICSPTRASIEASLDPDTDDGYLFFLSKLDGSREHVFARTYEEHLRNIDIWWRGGGPSPSP